MKTSPLVWVLLVLVIGAAGWFFYAKPDAQSFGDLPPLGNPLESSPDPLTLTPHTVPLPTGEEAEFRMPEEFGISVAAEGLGKARFMAMSPDGRLFVPDLVDYKLAHTGKIYILSDFDPVTGKFAEKDTYLSGLRGVNSVAFYKDEDGQDWLYVALTKNLIRYPYEAGDMKPSGDGEVIIEFPNQQSPGEVSVVWHITRTIFFHDDRLYVSVGSGCNSCEQLAGDMRAMIYSVKPDGSDERIEGDGLRNTVGIAMANGQLYATANGVDHLGNNAPEEMMYRVEGGKHYGWPFCYAQGGKMVPDTTQDWDEPLSCNEVPQPFTTFEPRSAPLGLAYFGANAHPALRNSFLIALHGSFEPSVKSFPRIMRVDKDGSQSVFMEGFQLADDSRIGRPVAFLQYDRNSFFFTDDEMGRVYYVYAK
jgi:glucose/arabinose dehydrogenase